MFHQVFSLSISLLFQSFALKFLKPVTGLKQHFIASSFDKLLLCYFQSNMWFQCFAHHHITHGMSTVLETGLYKYDLACTVLRFPL